MLDLQSHLCAAASAARSALEQTRPERKAFLSVLSEFEAGVHAARLDVPPSASEGVRAAANAFTARYEALRAILDGLVENTAKRMEKAFKDIERDADCVTIMLFGRTRAGKSTTMEALTGGDGASIGIGKQHTTIAVRAYYFPRTISGGPPEGPCLRIVDTPGIEGFEGEKLAAMAEEFIERSDHILFMLTDDKATSDELDRFGSIRTQGKSVTVLLNVKTTDDNLDLLETRPELVFLPHEIDGHKRRICGYLEREFAMPQPHLIPVHARAAWLGRRAENLPDGIASREDLLRNSRLPDVENRINEFIRNEALPARLNAPRDVLLGYLWPLKLELRPYASQFRRMAREVNALKSRLEDGVERARNQAVRRFPLLRARFQAASDAIPSIVDNVISAGANGTALQTQWRTSLRTHGVADAADWFIGLGRGDFLAELEEEVRAAQFDHEFTGPEGVDELFDGYAKAENNANRKKYGGAALRGAGAAGATLLATWAVANFWNPTGWAAAAAAVLVAGAGIIGEAGARQLSDSLNQSSKRELQTKRAEILTKLTEHIWADYRAVRAGCDQWLDQTKALHLSMVTDIAIPIDHAACRLWQATTICLDHLDAIAARISANLVADLFRAYVPECASGSLIVRAVARIPGERTKVIVVAAEGSRCNAMAACIGRQGTRIRQIRDALGGEKIDLVDGNADHEVQVLQGLGLLRTKNAVVILAERAGERTVLVRSLESHWIAVAVGMSGNNIRLAKELFGVNIVIEGGKP